MSKDINTSDALRHFISAMSNIDTGSKSAYEIAVSSGFEGTVDEYVDSIKSSTSGTISNSIAAPGSWGSAIGISGPSMTDPMSEYHKIQKMMTDMIAAQSALYDPDPSTLQRMSIHEIVEFIFAEFISTGRVHGCRSNKLYYMMTEYAKEETLSNSDPYNSFPGGYFNNNHNNNIFTTVSSSYRQKYHRLKLINSNYRQHNRRDNIIILKDSTKYLDLNTISISQSLEQMLHGGACVRIRIVISNGDIFSSQLGNFELAFEYDTSTESNNAGYHNKILRPHKYRFHIPGKDALSVKFTKCSEGVFDAHLVELRDEPIRTEFTYTPYEQQVLSDEDKFQLDLMNYSASLIPVLEVVKNDYGISFY